MSKISTTGFALSVQPPHVNPPSATALSSFPHEAGKSLNGPVEVRIAQFEDAAIKQTINGRCLQIRDFWDADSSLKDKRLCDRFRERNEFRRDTRGSIKEDDMLDQRRERSGKMRKRSSVPFDRGLADLRPLQDRPPLQFREQSFCGGPKTHLTAISDHEAIVASIHQETGVVCDVGPSGARASVSKRGLPGARVATNQDAVSIQLDAGRVDTYGMTRRKMKHRARFEQEVTKVAPMRQRRLRQPDIGEEPRSIGNCEVLAIRDLRAEMFSNSTYWRRRA